MAANFVGNEFKLALGSDYKGPPLSPFEKEYPWYGPQPTRPPSGAGDGGDGGTKPSRGNGSGGIPIPPSMAPRLGLGGPPKDGMGHPLPMPTLGGSGKPGIGGTTWAPGAIPIQGADGTPQMTFGGPSSWGGTHDDGYRIGPGNKTGDGKFHDTFGTNIGDIKAHGPMRGFAEGGTITGPGGPTDDAVPAVVGQRPIRVSDGEEIVDAATRDWFGKKFFVDLKRKAQEGMKGTEDADERTEPNGMADMMEDRREGEMDDPTGYATGGTVIENPYADDPALYAARQQQARDDELFKSGIIDYGGGNRTLSNRYGTGYAAPMITPQPGVFNDGGNAVMVLPGKGIKPIADVVPAGNPWSAGQMPFDAAAQRQDIASATARMLPGAESRRAADLFRAETEATLIPKGRREMIVPDARPNFGEGSGSKSDGERNYESGAFKAPWEKDSEAAAQRAAESGIPPGVRPSDWRRYQRSTRGIEQALDMQPQQWTPIPGTNYVQGRGGQTVPMARAQQAPITPADAAAMGLEVHSVDSKGNVTYRQRGGNTPAAKVHSTKEVDGLLYNVMSDGSMTRAIIDDPTRQAKIKAFKAQYEREPKTEADWSEAYYLASGKPRNASPTATPAADSKAPAPFKVTAKTTREELAKLPSGTPVLMPDGSTKYKR